MPKPTAFRMLAALAAVATLAPSAAADEGMWTFNAFPKDRVKHAHGFAPNDAWLEHTRLASAKLGGCSSSFVSGVGLVMTNHHCVQRCVEELSTARRDLMKDGFLAKTEVEEQRCPALEVRQLIGIEDVTARVTGATRGLPSDKFVDAQRAEMNRIEKECSTGPAAHCGVVTLYHGARYDLYRYKRYDDVRLVFAPELGAAFFGGDPDNFMFPRYALDVSFVRVYEGGRPSRTEHFFRWRNDGPKDGALVFMSGHPGSTQRLLTVAQLEYLRDAAFPAQLRAMAELRGVLTQFGRAGAEQKRIAQATLFSLENNYKRAVGQHAALLERAFFAAKVAAEESLRAKVAKNAARKKAYGTAWDEIARVQAAKRRLSLPHDQLERGAAFDSTLFRLARIIVRGVEERARPNEERLREFAEAGLRPLTARLLSPAPIHRELEILTLGHSLAKMRELLGPDDATVRKILGKESPEDLARALIGGSKLTDPAVRKKLWDGGRAAVEASDDPLVRLARSLDAEARALRKRYEDEVEGPEKKNAELVAKARFDVLGTSVHPDATGTLRLAYGVVKGYEDRGRQIASMTTIGGAFERATGKDPFALPRSWVAAKTRLRPETPFVFVSTADSIGGNSGSPILNTDGEIVGINFDSNIHALNRAFGYEAERGRQLGLHTGAITEVLRAVYGADRVVDEVLAVRKAAN